MKCFSLILSIFFVYFAYPAFCASGLQVTPSVVEEDFLGNMLVEANVEQGSRSRVDIFIDFNRDGQVNGEDFPMFSYYVTDGEQFQVQGIALTHVPGDTDGVANGALQIAFPQSRVRFFLGYYVVRVDDGEGAVEAALEFRQNETDIEISGQVSRDGNTSEGYPALVNVYSETEGIDYSIVVPTDASGQYSAYLPYAATYVALALRPGAVAVFDEGGGMLFYRQPEDIDTIDLNLLTDPQRTSTISGRARGVFPGNDTEPLPFVLVVGESWIEVDGDEEETGFSLTIADEDGDYYLTAVDGNWGLSMESLESRGFVGRDEGDRLVIVEDGDDRSGQDLLADRPMTSVIRGRLLRTDTDPPEPLNGFVVEAETLEEEFYTEAVMNENGEFLLGVFEEEWDLYFLPENFFQENYMPIPQVQSVSVDEGVVHELDDILVSSAAGVLRVTTLDQQGRPVSEIVIGAFYQGAGGGVPNLFRSTEADGAVVLLLSATGTYTAGPVYSEDRFRILPPTEFVTVPADEIVDLTFTVPLGGLVEGLIEGESSNFFTGRIVVYDSAADSINEHEYYVATTWPNIRDDYPAGINYQVPLLPGAYKLHAVDFYQDSNDSWGFVPQFSGGTYDMSTAQVITIPGARERVRVDFDLVRGGQIFGQVFSSIPSQNSGGMFVEALNPGTMELVTRAIASWQQVNTGFYRLWVPAGDYILRTRPALGTNIFHPVYYDQASEPGQASTVEVEDFEELQQVNFTFDPIMRKPGDMDLDGMVRGLDLLLFSTVWYEDVETNIFSLLANDDDSDTIDEWDLLEWRRNLQLDR